MSIETEVKAVEAEVKAEVVKVEVVVRGTPINLRASMYEVLHGQWP